MEQENKSNYVVVKFRKDLVPPIYSDKELFTIYDENNARRFGKELETRAKYLKIKEMIVNEYIAKNVGIDETTLEKMDEFLPKLFELINK